MTDRARLEQALIAADRAGDTAAATKLAAALRSMTADAPVMENGMQVMPSLPGESTTAAAPLSDAYDTFGSRFKRYLSGIDEAAGRVNEADGGRTSPIGTMEAVGTLATGAIAPVTGLLRGVATRGQNETLDQAVERATKESIYTPRTESGKAKVGMLAAVAAPLTETGADVALAPLAAESQSLRLPAKVPGNARGPSTASRTGARVGKEMAESVSTRQDDARLVQAAQSPAQAAIADGYKLKPSETGAKAGSVVEGLTGSAKLEGALVKRNQANTNRLAREEFGLAEGPVTPALIEKAKGKHNRVYAEVGRKLGEVETDAQFKTDIEAVGRTPGTSFKKDVSPAVEDLKKAYVDETRFNGSDAILKVRQLRYKANRNIGGRDPQMQELGYAQKAIADAIEAQMDRKGQALGHKDLMKRFATARQELAKLNSLQAATRGGEVDALILKRQLEKGVPLSGNLRRIAEHAANFENVLRPGRKVKGNTPVNMWETATALAGAATTAASNPAVGLPMIAAAAVRPAARRFLMSDRYQNNLARRARVEPKAPTRNKLAELNY